MKLATTNPVHNDLSGTTTTRLLAEFAALAKKSTTSASGQTGNRTSTQSSAASLPQGPQPPAPLTPAPTGVSQGSPPNLLVESLGGGVAASAVVWAGNALGIPSQITWTVAALASTAIGDLVGGGSQGGNLLIWNPGLNGGQYVNFNISPELSTGDNQGYAVGASVSQNQNGQIVDTITVVPN